MWRRSGHRGGIGFPGGTGFEKERTELFRAEDALQFPESEEGDKSAEDNQTAAEQVVDADLPERASHGFAMNQQPDRFFEDMKGKYEQTKEKGFVNGGNK